MKFCLPPGRGRPLGKETFAVVITAGSRDQKSQLDTIRFSLGAVHCMDPMTIESEADLLEAIRMFSPVAHVIRDSDIPAVTALSDRIVDRGAQKRTGKDKKTVELSRTLLGQGGRIPLLRAIYGNAGRTREGIEKLLEKARARADHNLYLIAVRANIYDRLREQMWRKREPVPGQAIFLERIADDPLLAAEYLGRAPEYVNVRKNIIVAAASEIPVLIMGETGTGKELVARAIHNRSPRFTAGPFISVNCAAIPSDLLEEEFFGVEPGVVTNVTRLKKGLWELADKGTIFLDEIGDMAVEHQRKILRVLQEGVIRRVGGKEDIEVKARVIAATNRDLLALTKKREFREDLYYRLSVFTIYTPALRNAPGEVEYIAQKCWEAITEGTKPPLPSEVVKQLAAYAVSGNVRTIKNILAKLHACMKAEKLERVGRKYFEAAMRAPDFVRPEADPVVTRDDIHSYRGECMAALRQASKAVRRCKVALHDFLWEGARDGDSVKRAQAKLEQPHGELDSLCLDPSVFYGQETFAEVACFSGQLSNFRKLLDQDPAQAAAYWEADLGAQYDLAIGRVQKEIRALVESD